MNLNFPTKNQADLESSPDGGSIPISGLGLCTSLPVAMGGLSGCSDSFFFSGGTKNSTKTDLHGSSIQVISQHEARDQGSFGCSFRDHEVDQKHHENFGSKMVVWLVF